MSSLSTLFGSTGGIKSVQTGTISVTTGGSSWQSGSNTATISAVNTAKAFVLFGGAANVAFNVTAISARVDLTNSTTVTATASSAGATATVTVSYTVVEFN